MFLHEFFFFRIWMKVYLTRKHDHDVIMVSEETFLLTTKASEDPPAGHLPLDEWNVPFLQHVSDVN